MYPQHELFRVSNGQTEQFVPRRVPLLTKGMRQYLDALLVSNDLRRILGHKIDYRPLRRLIRERLVECEPGSPARYTVTRLGLIARALHMARIRTLKRLIREGINK